MTPFAFDPSRWSWRRSIALVLISSTAFWGMILFAVLHI